MSQNTAPLTLDHSHFGEQIEKPRLGAVRALMDMEVVNLSTIVDRYNEWVTYDEYLVFKQTHKHSGEIKFKAAMMSKRGNRYYAHRQRQRFKDFDTLPDVEWFNYKDRSKRHTTNGIFISLLVKPDDCTIGEAWEGIGECRCGCGKRMGLSRFHLEQRVSVNKETGEEILVSFRAGCDGRAARLVEGISYRWNRFITAIRKKYGECSAIKAVESHESGYPHIHAILLFKDKSFDAFIWNGKWRVQERDEVNEYWPWWTDIKAVNSVNGGVRYLVKYLTKVNTAIINPSEDIQEASKHQLSLALLWAYRKRAYSVSKDVLDMIRQMHNSNELVPFLIQSDLSGEVKLWTYDLVGFWGGRLLRDGGKYPLWSSDLTRNQFFSMKKSMSWSERK